MIEIDTHMDGRWIKASDASDLAIRCGEDVVAFRAAAAEFLRDGRLRARAEAVWISCETNMNKAWESISTTENVERNIEVPVRYWRADIRAATDRNRWRWMLNNFACTIGTKPLKRRMIMGVEFLLDDLKDIKPNLFDGAAKKTRGPDKDIENIENGWLQIVRISQSTQGLNLERFRSAASLQKVIEDRLADANGHTKPGKEKIKGISSKVYKLLVALRDGEENGYEGGAPSED